MANNDEQLQIVINAIDNASATLKQIADNSEQSMAKVADSTGKTTDAQQDLSRAVFNGVAAWDLLKKGVEIVSGFFEEGIKSAIDYDKTLAQISGTLKQIGPAATAQLPAIDAFLNGMAKIGVSDNEAAVAFNTLVKATGDVNKAMQLTSAASDLTSSGYYDLQTNATNLANVMTGHGARSAIAYKLELSSTATTADYLNAILGKVSTTTEEFSKTTVGQVAVIHETYANLQQAVGEGLVLAFHGFADEAVSAMVGTQGSMQELTDDTATFGIVAGGAIGLVIDDIKMLVAGGEGLTKSFLANFGAIIKAVQGFGDAIRGNGDDAHKKYQEAMDMQAQAEQATADAMSKIGNYADDAGQKWHDMTHSGEVLKDLKAQELASLITGAAAKEAAIAAENAQAKAAAAVVKHADAIAKLKTEYDKMAAGGASDLATLADDFNQKMGAIQDAIKKTTADIADLTASYNLNRTSETGNVADDIVSSEQKIADIKKQLAAATTQDQINNLNTQLAEEQKNYDSSLAFRTANAAAITEAERRSAETSLQREIEDYNTRTKMEADEYAKKLATLQQELLDKQTESVQEMVLYQTKVAQINAILDTGNAYFTKLSNDRKATTTAEVNDEVAQFQRLAAAISQTKSASISAISTVQIPTIQGITIPAHEAGGFVNAPRGTAVPIMAHGGEEVIPAEQVAGRSKGGTINIVINNPSVRNDGDINALRRQLEDLLRPVLLNAKIIHT